MGDVSLVGELVADEGKRELKGAKGAVLCGGLALKTYLLHKFLTQD